MKISIVLLIFLSTSFMVNAQKNKTLHDFTVETLEGEEFDLSQLKGKKVLVVNTASKCGYTPQYADLQKLYEMYGGEKFEIIGFPANNFLSQEPGTNTEIREFCTRNYGVTFPMMAKISVKGKDMHPVYRWLTSKEENGVMDSSVRWNFQKYLVDENGKLVDVAYSKVNPLSDTIVDWIGEE
ncbi:MAG: glutathione peroxidase [Bacteroidales bacterium]|nr:MAG: glutathione peroxidase [Bacteroidales bacterium]